jgi:hypothetical protein
MNSNSLGYALVQWIYRTPAGRLVRIRQWHPSDTTPKAILRRQTAHLPYTKYCLVKAGVSGAEYADLQPHSEHDVEYNARLSAQHLMLIKRAGQ